jgi:hypothetical protein
MATRAEVYAAIDSELTYAEHRWREACCAQGIDYRPDNTKSVEEWLMFIRGYFNDAAYAVAHHAGYEPTLHVVRKLAGLCFSCMLAHGAPQRQIEGYHILTPRILPGPLVMNQVHALVDRERYYQGVLGPNRTDARSKSVPGYLCMFDSYLRKAIDAWTFNAGDTLALENIRKLAGIAVHCMEDHGAPHRG